MEVLTGPGPAASLEYRYFGGQHRYIVDDPSMSGEIQLLAAVADVGRHAHTDATLVAGLAAVLARTWPLRSLELGRCAGARAETRVTELRVARPPRRGTRALGSGPVAEAIRAGRRAMVGAATGPTLLLSLDQPPGAYLLASLTRPIEVPGDPLLDALATVIGVCAEQARLLARVASLSRRAIADKEAIVAAAGKVRSDDEIAVDATMRGIFDRVVPLVARQDTTVLLQGETGTGKEVVARRIHRLSPRARRPFLGVDCSAIPETLVESALFGHERGAFTGAVRRHAGFFERAHGGTLLLDEVGELSASMQVKLLRVLQEGEVLPVGAERPLRVDVRVIAATHRDLEAMSEEGRFRRDLLYRLQVVPIQLPPLRERRDDLAPLVAGILRRLAARLGRSFPPRVPARTMARLAAHRWPGNVRELQNVLERALVLEPGHELVLPADFGATRRRSGTAARETYRDAQRRILEQALASSGGRIYGPTGAAAALAMKPTTLQSKLKKLGIAGPRRR
jgi:formate hydrogenlyase transcriptional activator